MHRFPFAGVGLLTVGEQFSSTLVFPACVAGSVRYLRRGSSFGLFGADDVSRVDLSPLPLRSPAPGYLPSMLSARRFRLRRLLIGSLWRCSGQTLPYASCLRCPSRLRVPASRMATL
ncbi:hypothetical protein V9T40_008482 [Parthenolecanium corni]|uniref:Uncharacterized protein n=1 Tax=Parthenolecanium corni TaxID=536013 RepID=A0AAN9Y6M1_9HEMI